MVWADNPNPDPRLDNRLKDVAAKLDLPPLREELRRFVDWVAGYTLSPRGMVARMTLRMGEQLGPERLRVGVRLAGPPPERMTPARARVLQLLADGLARGKTDAAHEAGVSVGVVDGLIDEGTLEVLELPAAPVAPPPDPAHAVPDFTAAQAAAGAALREAVRSGFSVTLVDGVTGSGKTEVYFEAVAEAVARGRQSLILMPEIALTAQFLDRFAARFGVRPAEWHSELTPRKRARTWHAVAAGEVAWSPARARRCSCRYADLGLIIVDEEHDAAYKQEDGVHYHARDMAVVRGHIAKIPVVLASRHPRSRPRSMRGAGAIAGCRCRSASAARRSRRSRPSTSPATARRAGALSRRGSPKPSRLRPRTQRTGAPVPQPARLCAANLVPRLRVPVFLPALRCLAGRPSLSPPAGLPSLRLLAPQPAGVPEMPAAASFVACGPGVERIAEEAAALFPKARGSWCCRATSSPPPNACAKN